MTLASRDTISESIDSTIMIDSSWLLGDHASGDELTASSADSSVLWLTVEGVMVCSGPCSAFSVTMSASIVVAMREGLVPQYQRVMLDEGSDPIVLRPRQVQVGRKRQLDRKAPSLRPPLAQSAKRTCSLSHADILHSSSISLGRQNQEVGKGRDAYAEHESEMVACIV